MKVRKKLFLFHQHFHLDSRIFIGLSARRVKMSAESCLKNLASRDDNNLTTSKEVSKIIIQKNRMTCIEMLLVLKD